tara:strand:- start:206 stop:457 length:252 start_codon:yes stop_codon:yes gene_type:complete
LNAPHLLDLLAYPTCHRDAAARLISRALELQPDSPKAHNSPVNIDKNREDRPTAEADCIDLHKTAGCGGAARDRPAGEMMFHH